MANLASYEAPQYAVFSSIPPLCPNVLLSTPFSNTFSKQGQSYKSLWWGSNNLTEVDRCNQVWSTHTFQRRSLRVCIPNQISYSLTAVVAKLDSSTRCGEEKNPFQALPAIEPRSLSR